MSLDVTVSDLLFEYLASQKLSVIRSMLAPRPDEFESVAQSVPHTFEGELWFGELESSVRTKLFTKLAEFGFEQVPSGALVNEWAHSGLRAVVLDPDIRQRKSADARWQLMNALMQFETLAGLPFDPTLGSEPVVFRPSPTGTVQAARSGNGRTVTAGSAAWHKLRDRSISATDASKLVTPRGAPSVQAEALIRKKTGVDSGWDGMTFAMELGLELEPKIAAWLQELAPRMELAHNSLLLQAKSNSRFVATPDLVGSSLVGDIKVSIKDFLEVSSKYWNQIQWQLLVAEMDFALLVAVDPTTHLARFGIIKKDIERVSILVDEANGALMRIDEHFQRGAESSAPSSENALPTKPVAPDSLPPGKTRKWKTFLAGFIRS